MTSSTPVSGSDDRAPDCPEHVWRLGAVTFAAGAFSEYVCVRCDADMLVGPGEWPPQTV